MLSQLKNIQNSLNPRTEIITFISANRSRQQMFRSFDVCSIIPSPLVRTLNLEFSDCRIADPTPENKSLRLADVVPIGSPDLSSSSRVLMSLKYVVRLYAVKSDP